MDSPSLHMNIEVLVICGEMPSRGRLYTWVHLPTSRLLHWNWLQLDVLNHQIVV